ncbi:deoxyribodipyrimidine photo-lyase [Monoraphidium neglectum]|uniref:Deoxyribodipyrimidine photo-lyase n=1 Tax=Monoraphidium neglectum TaxID=145388 RepID=A0A0D2J259_9CHLO|nr:deoxyribodipyrimidine photo-lyase [Monoraphidium neglectum]KIY94077.1 deoxyribodipyrimidine photo-lyase [Monoraphidium neglectum]|eukprot:XP_013893097.1 deoxyribodipyrimidine photo-lyase [Monoraphidium neglectum]
MASTSSKRKAEPKEADAGPSSKKSAAGPSLVNPKRWKVLHEGTAGDGPVIYWMSRDQRMRDNWALLHALEQAGKKGAPAAVAFNLVPEFLGAGARQFVFMLKGLREMAPRLEAHGIPFFLLQARDSNFKGDPAATIPKLVRDTGAGLLVTDYSPLRLGRQWRDQVSAALGAVPFHEVDAHNVVPVWSASDKREYGARTIRPKIHKALPEFLCEYPETPRPAPWTSAVKPDPIDWEALLSEVRRRGAAVPEVRWCTPGEDGAHDALLGEQGFLTPARLALYDAKRNDPGEPQALSNLSPWLHFGQLSTQRAALEAAKLRGKYKILSLVV